MQVLTPVLKLIELWFLMILVHKIDFLTLLRLQVFVFDQLLIGHIHSCSLKHLILELSYVHYLISSYDFTFDVWIIIILVIFRLNLLNRTLDRFGNILCLKFLNFLFNDLFQFDNLQISIFFAKPTSYTILIFPLIINKNLLKRIGHFSIQEIRSSDRNRINFLR